MLIIAFMQYLRYFSSLATMLKALSPWGDAGRSNETEFL